jgi:hypothetical protein
VVSLGLDSLELDLPDLFFEFFVYSSLLVNSFLFLSLCQLDFRESFISQLSLLLNLYASFQPDGLVHGRVCRFINNNISVALTCDSF